MTTKVRLLVAQGDIPAGSIFEWDPQQMMFCLKRNKNTISTVNLAMVEALPTMFEKLD